MARNLLLSRLQLVMRQVLLTPFSNLKSTISSLRERSSLYAMVVAKSSRDISVLRSIFSVGSQKRRTISRLQVSSTSQPPRLRGEKVDLERGESPEGKMMTTTEEIGNLARAIGEIAKSDLIEGTGMNDEIAEIVATVVTVEIVEIVEIAETVETVKIAVIGAIEERIEGIMMIGETEVMAIVEDSRRRMAEIALKGERGDKAENDAPAVIDRMVDLTTGTLNTLRLEISNLEMKMSTSSLRLFQSQRGKRLERKEIEHS